MAVREKARRVAHAPWLERWARIGLVTRALLQGIVALLALQVAVVGRSGKADKGGALEEIAARPFGRWLLVAVVVGLAGYAAWRLLMAVVGPGEGSRAKRLAKRIGFAARGLLYAAIAFSTARLVAGTTGEDRFEEADATSTVLALPLGRVLVALLGAAFVVGAGRVGWRAVTGAYKKHLDLHRLSKRQKLAVTWAAVLGLCARGIVWALVATFLLRAAFFQDPNETVGLDGALRAVASAPQGRVLLSLLAGGLLAHAVFGLIEARFRRVASS